VEEIQLTIQDWDPNWKVHVNETEMDHLENEEEYQGNGQGNGNGYGTGDM
jgi:hypothetical protein